MPYECQTCGKGFKTAQQLSNHEATHTGEKKFPCDFPGCEVRFAVQTALIHGPRGTPCPAPGCEYRDTRKGFVVPRSSSPSFITANHPSTARMQKHCLDCGHGLELVRDRRAWDKYCKDWKDRPESMGLPF
ncbi:hypothetical protein LTR28_001628 [Elasticomyces elasticus]|nr:hypothetical protein LTR28_001628 [Elasticomyces elasticus]